MRDYTDRTKIEIFLQSLGKIFKRNCKLYLVGGTVIVHKGLKLKTIDIDICYELPQEFHSEFIETIKFLKESLNINIEEVNPGYFIPLPEGYKDRSIFIGKFGEIKVFYFDPYSVALGKIERGTEIDFEDVLHMLKTQMIDFELLEKYFLNVMQRYGKESIRQNPENFKRKFEYIKRKVKG